MRFTLVALLLLQDPVKLEHKGKRGQSTAFKQTVRFGITFKGEEDTVDKIKALTPLFSLQDFALEGESTFEVLKAPKDGSILWKGIYEKARIHGTYDDEEFEYNFTRETKVTTGEDKLKDLVYTIFMGGRSHKLSKLGVMEDVLDPNKDPNGEALELILYPMPRFQDKAIQAGETWTEEWLSRTTDKDGKHKIKFKQTVTVEFIEAGVAQLKVRLGGQMHKTEELKSFTHAVTPQAEATVRFDIEKGHVVGYESNGSVDIHVKGADPNSTEEYDVHLILSGAGKLDPR